MKIPWTAQPTLVARNFRQLVPLLWSDKPQVKRPTHCNVLHEFFIIRLSFNFLQELGWVHGVAIELSHTVLVLISFVFLNYKVYFTHFFTLCEHLHPFSPLRLGQFTDLIGFITDIHNQIDNLRANLNVDSSFLQFFLSPELLRFSFLLFFGGLSFSFSLVSHISHFLVNFLIFGFFGLVENTSRCFFVLGNN